MTARLPPLVLVAMLAVISGCAFGRRYSAVRPGVNQTLRVESGDRIYFDLEEGSRPGREWDFECDDKDVTVSIAHRDGKASAEVRIHRGYDGPSRIAFFRKGARGKDPERFVLTLFRRTGDAAFWE